MDLSCVPEYGTVGGAAYALFVEVAMDPPWHPDDFVYKFQYQDDRNGQSNGKEMHGGGG